MGLVLTQLPLPILSTLRLSIAEAFARLLLSGVSTHTVAKRFIASGFVMRDQCILVIPRQPGRQCPRNTDTDGPPYYEPFRSYYDDYPRPPAPIGRIYYN